MQSIPNRLLSMAPQSQRLGPAGTDVGAGQSVQIGAFRGLATVSHQVDFQEARLVIIPVRKGANRDGFLEQAPWFGGAQAV